MSLRESGALSGRVSNFRPDKNVTNKSGPIEQRISFFTLATLAFPGDKPEVAIATLTGRDPRTVRRWLADQHGRPQIALAVVLGELLRRLD